ncbi:lipid IV(A) 3-deoxy-D-manno-octulosonic acid transferase [Porticoccaceae bacterium]|nr:lipid IV(A) 3-deoxy-D-manno-octulosonic acid transferase [Porticoccaceae bacterium]
MVRATYSLVLYLLSPIIIFHLWSRGLKNKSYRGRLAERLGFYRGQLKAHSLVLHCASVGEIMAARPLINRLLSETPSQILTITCNTPSGSEQIHKLFGDSVQHIYLPLDFPRSVARFLEKLKPKALVILETELWPNLIIKSKQYQLPVLVVNGRLSAKSLSKYQLFSSLSKELMGSISVVAGHSEEDLSRFKQLGLDDAKASATGSIKFDIGITGQARKNAETLKVQLANYDFVWVAGSTHPKEHEQILEAHSQLSKNINSLLIIAPRHMEQFKPVAELLSDSKIGFAERSKNNLNGQPVLLADSMGELMTFFGVANCAFIGGSLIDRGGHNPLEAAAWSIPVITGPSYYNFAQIYPQLIANKGCIEVDSAKALGEQLKLFASKPEQAMKQGQKALEIVKQNQGALDKMFKLILKFLN